MSRGGGAVQIGKLCARRSTGLIAIRINISISPLAQLNAAKSLRVRLTRSLGRGFNPWRHAFD
jgi:hypothetical protein